MQLQELFKVALSQRASDLHLLVGLKPFIRVDGVLRPLETLEVLTAETIAAIIFESISPEQKAKFLAEKELDLSMKLGEEARFRVNVYYEKDNLAFAARVILPQIPTMEDIALPKVVWNMIADPNGLILVTGPTGNGKSTTLAAIVNYLNQTQPYHIVTLEDPIEFIFQPVKSIISQRQLVTDMVSFSAGLKHVLRQDPNVIVLGEMRDLETMGAALTLAETGHLVLATLHTQNAAQTVDRIIDVFPTDQQQQVRSQLSLTLRGVLSQRLVPKIGGGRLALREIMVNIPAIGNLIRENKVAQVKNIIQTGSEYGMFTMDQDVKRLYEAGQITREVALSNMESPEGIV